MSMMIRDFAIGRSSGLTTCSYITYVLSIF